MVFLKGPPVKAPHSRGGGRSSIAKTTVLHITNHYKKRAGEKTKRVGCPENILKRSNKGRVLKGNKKKRESKMKTKEKRGNCSLLYWIEHCNLGLLKLLPNFLIHLLLSNL